MKNKIAILSLLVTMICTSAVAQNYKSALGVRISGNSSVGGFGLTYRHFLNEKTSLEGILSLKDPFGVAGLYQLHRPITGVDNLTWFYGGGAYISFSKPDIGAGLLGNIGMDYKFDAVPINLSVDWKPEIALAPKAGINFNTFGFSIRYVFGGKKNKPAERAVEAPLE
jgi:hypothetical protein